MPKKSLIDRSFVDKAQRAHNCQANAAHRIQSGDIRLKVAEGRSYLHYCAACGIAIVQKDILKLTALAQDLQVK